MKFTPGPWEAKRMATNHEVQAANGVQVVADVYSAGTGTHEANARLIAVAPEMYEALKLYQSHHEGTRGHYCSECHEAITKALAKVEAH